MKAFLLHRIGPALIPFLMGHTLVFTFEDHSFPFSMSSYFIFILAPSTLLAACVFAVSGIKDAARRHRAYYGAGAAIPLVFAQYVQFLIAIEGTMYVVFPYWGLSFFFVACMWLIASKIASVPYLVLRLVLLLASLWITGVAFLYAARYFLGLR